MERQLRVLDSVCVPLVPGRSVHAGHRTTREGRHPVARRNARVVARTAMCVVGHHLYGVFRRWALVPPRAAKKNRIRKHVSEGGSRPHSPLTHSPGLIRSKVRGFRERDLFQLRSGSWLVLGSEVWKRLVVFAQHEIWEGGFGWVWVGCFARCGSKLMLKR